MPETQIPKTGDKNIKLPSPISFPYIADPHPARNPNITANDA